MSSASGSACCCRGLARASLPISHVSGEPSPVTHDCTSRNDQGKSRPTSLRSDDTSRDQIARVPYNYLTSVIKGPSSKSLVRLPLQFLCSILPSSLPSITTLAHIAQCTHTHTTSHDGSGMRPRIARRAAADRLVGSLPPVLSLSFLCFAARTDDDEPQQFIAVNWDAPGSLLTLP